MDVHLHYKCAICKQPIVVSQYDCSFVSYKNSYNHISCLVKKMVSHRRISLRWSDDQADSQINLLIEQTRPIIEKALIKNYINLLIAQHYGLSVITSGIFTRLDAIYTGGYKGMYKPLPPEHLYDMWVQKLDWLDRQALKAKGNKNVLHGEKRVFYDLAILVNRYDGYLQWLATKQVEQTEVQQKYDDTSCQMVNLNRMSVGQKKPLGDKVDLFAIANELWD